MWLNHERPVMNWIRVHRSVQWVSPVLRKTWRIVPSSSLTLPAQGMLQRALKNFLKLVPSLCPFQSSMELVFQNIPTTTTNPSGFPAILVIFWEGKRNAQTSLQPVWLLISLREAHHEVLSKLPHCPEPSFSVYLFVPILEQPANDFTPFCLAAKSNTITPLRAASVGSKNKMGSFSC